MDFAILGPIQVCTNEGPVTIRSARQRSILAVLILNVGRVVSADRLLDLVWGETPPSSGARSLQFHVWKLRNALDPQRKGGEGIIATRAPGYVLLAEPGDVDAVRFERMTSEAHDLLSSDPARSRRLIQEAMGLWRGPALDDLAYEEFARLEIIRLEQLRQRADEDRIEAALAMGDHDAVVGELAALTAQHPLRERLWGQYMIALARSGRQAEALAAYQDLARNLGEQLGIDPSAELQAIEERILLQDPQILVPGQLPPANRLRGYTLRARLGTGAFGEVWQAVQPGIGRDVAIKVIRPDLANRPEFVLGFEAEARLLASLEHPNIVPLFDFWRDPAGAYLVMPLMRGGSLARAAQDAPLALEPCLATVVPIADALAYAHRRQVVHGDLTPENVLLDDEGRPYLADFGVASLVGGTGGAQQTSPGFRSPEQLGGEAPTARSDVFGLGKLAYLLLTGNPPPPGEQLPPVTTLAPELADAVDGVLATATAPEPTDRYEGPEAFVAALSAAVGSAMHQLPSAVARNPYKGLCAFSEADAADFFGREALTADLTAAVVHHRLVGVVGPSGCGKSSLVRAGLIPSLRRGAVPGSERWLVADLSPGVHPMAELEAALLGVAARPTLELRDVLADSVAEPASLAAALAPDGGELLLLVDQLEELFTLTRSDAERRRFIDFLTHVAGDPRSRIRVVVTLRADFYDRPLEFAAFGEMLGRGVVSVATPSEASLALAVSGPAGGVGVTLDPGLATEIARDVGDQPGGLPLMEYALTELFGRRSGAQITAEDYHAMGGVTGALGRRAEELYAQYDEEGRASVRQIFLRLVQVGEDATDTRRRVPRHELTGLGIDSTFVDDVLGSFGAHRLFTFDRDPTTRSPTVEVAHEALLTRWDRLRGWVEERRDDLLLHRRLAVAVSEWRESGQDPGYLLTGGRLAHFEEFAGETDLALTDAEHEYLRESRRRADEDATRRRRRRRVVLAGFAAAAVVGSLLAVLALIASAESNRNATLARSRELAASAIAVAGTDPELSLLLALESAEGGEPIFESVTALHQAVLDQRVLRRFEGPAFSQSIMTPDGSGVLVNSVESGTAQMYDAATGRLIWEAALMPGSPEPIIQSYAFDRDGAEMLYSNGELYALDTATGAVRKVPFDTPCPELGPVLIADGALRIDVDHPLLMFEMTDGGECDFSRFAVARIDSSTGAAEVLAEFDSPQVSIVSGASDATGNLLALTVFDEVHEIVVFDVMTGETQSYGRSGVDGAATLSPDGTLVATIGNERNDVWDVAGGGLLWKFPGRMSVVRFSADGRLILGSPLDGPGRIWDARSGEELMVLHGVGPTDLSDDGLRALDGQSILNTGANGEVGAFDFPRQARYGHGDLNVTPDRLAVRWGCRTKGCIAGVFDRTSGELLFSVRAAGDDIGLSPDGRLLAVQEWPSEDAVGSVRVYDTSSGESVLMEGLCTWDAPTLTGPGCRNYPEIPFKAAVSTLTFTPDGSRLIGGMVEFREPHARPMLVWDAQTGAIVYRSPEELAAWSPLMTADGERIFVSTYDGEPVTLETNHWTQVEGPPLDWLFQPMVLTPDSRHLVIGTEPDAGLKVVDTNTWETVRQAGGLEAEQVLAVDPSGTLIASGGDSGFVRIYSFETLHMLQQIPVGEPIRNLAWLNERHVLVTPISGPGIVVTTDIDELLEVAGSRVTRRFTASECAVYHIDPCPLTDAAP